MNIRMLVAALILLSGAPFAAAQTNYTPYTFITYAGHAGLPDLGQVDGTGAAAGFVGVRGLAVDPNGNVYVADGTSALIPGGFVNQLCAIRKIAPGGFVTTLAGSKFPPLLPGSGSNDGTGSAASFSNPNGVAVDVAGNVFVADTSNNTIRKITPAGVVTTFAGSAGSAGS